MKRINRDVKKLKTRTNSKRPSKTKSRRIKRINQTSKRVVKLPSKIKSISKKQLERELLYDFENEFEKSEKRTNRKNSKADRKNNSKSNIKKKTARIRISKRALAQKIKRQKRTITSYLYHRSFDRTIFSINLNRKDEIDLLDESNRDAGMIYLVLLPYLMRLLKKIKKPKELFSIHLGYFDGLEQSYVSTEYKKTKPIPEQQENALLELIELLIHNAQKYEMKLGIFFINELQIRFYED